MSALAEGLVPFSSLIADPPQHVEPHPLHERLAHGDVE
jgi:hypothetical protein